jgi:hypothetical protein
MNIHEMHIRIANSEPLAYDRYQSSPFRNRLTYHWYWRRTWLPQLGTWCPLMSPLSWT